MPYVTPTTEILDLSKDIYYVVTFPHQQLWLVVVLWSFTLLNPLWTFFSIMFMTVEEYKHKFGSNDTGIWEQEINGEIGNLRMIYIKTVRGFRESLSFHRSEDLETEKVQRRQIRHKFQVAFFENLPQSVLQLYETFAIGKTYGAYIMFSTCYSIIMFQNSSAQMLPEIQWQLMKHCPSFKGKFGLQLT